MAREFSRQFYKTKAWKQTREYIFNKYYGLCVDCGKPGKEVHHKTFLKPDNMNDANITLGENNLVLLCKECHHKRHNVNTTTREELMFDEFGNLVKK